MCACERSSVYLHERSGRSFNAFGVMRRLLRLISLRSVVLDRLKSSCIPTRYLLFNLHIDTL